MTECKPTDQPRAIISDGNFFNDSQEKSNEKESADCESADQRNESSVNSEKSVTPIKGNQSDDDQSNPGAQEPPDGFGLGDDLTKAKDQSNSSGDFIKDALQDSQSISVEEGDSNSNSTGDISHGLPVDQENTVSDSTACGDKEKGLMHNSLDTKPMLPGDPPIISRKDSGRHSSVDDAPVTHLSSTPEGAKPDKEEPKNGCQLPLHGDDSGTRVKDEKPAKPPPKPALPARPPALPAKPAKFVRPSASSPPATTPPLPTSTGACERNSAVPAITEEPKIEQAKPTSPASGKTEGKTASSIFKKSFIPPQISRLFRDKSPVKKEKPLSIKPEPRTESFEDATVAESESLSHPTTQRPKNKNKRPPSQTFLKEMAVNQSLPAPDTAVDQLPAATPKPTLVLPIKPSRSPAPRPVDDGPREEFVRKEDFENLKAAFEAFRRDMIERVAALESRLS